MMYRRFGYLISRLLLDKQNEVQQIEKEIDEQDKHADKEELQNGEINTEDPSYRKVLLIQVEGKLREYGKSR